MLAGTMVEMWANLKLTDAQMVCCLVGYQSMETAKELKMAAMMLKELGWAQSLVEMKAGYQGLQFDLELKGN